MESIKLNRNNLPRVNAAVSIPRYSRQDLSPSIVHIGLGNFHRSHQAAYLDELLEKGIEKRGIFGINLVPGAFPLEKILKEQDYLYTLITKDPFDDVKVRIAGSVMGYLNGAANRQAAIEHIADNGTALVTLTVTEKGYYFDRKTGEIDSSLKAVQNDLEHPEVPATAAATIARALALRYKTGRAPLTIMSCDNIPSNGRVLENCVLYYCENLYREIIPWVKDRVSFPCSMVDRITPVTTEALTKELEERYGICDRWPVCGEDFRQWILEDNFKTPVPPYEEAGVQIVKSAEPYELMKMRLLNGSHSALAYPSYLLGCRMVDEGIGNPLIKRFIRDCYMEEVTATLEPVQGIDLGSYKDTLISRFSNKNIGDTILRLCSEGSSKIPGFIAKPLSQAIRRGLPHKNMIFALAACARFYEGIDEQGIAIPLDDINSRTMSEAAQSAATNPETFLNLIGLNDLNADQTKNAAAEFKTALEKIRTKGIRAALS